MIEIRLSAIPLPGLSPDSLGNYLASLGLLRVLSRKWPSTHIAWRDEVLQVVAGPPTLDVLVDELVRVADTQADSDVGKREWTQYDKAWSEAQKKGTKAKSGGGSERKPSLSPWLDLVADLERGEASALSSQQRRRAARIKNTKTQKQSSTNSTTKHYNQRNVPLMRASSFVGCARRHARSNNRGAR